MKIIITGATGFLGLHLAEHFRKNHHEVFGIGRNTDKGKYLTQIGCHFIKASLEKIDLNNTEEDWSIMKNADVLVHSAALSSPWGNKEDFYQANILGTKNILELVVKYKVKRFVHISTPSLYFKFKDDFNISEDRELLAPFASLYTASKFEAEKLVDKAHREQNLFTVTLRPRGIFGPGDEALLPRLIKVAGTQGLPVIGDGKNIIDLTYVENVVFAVEKSIGASDICNGQKYNITNGESVQLYSFLNHIFKELNIKISTRKIPFYVAYIYAFFLETIHKYLLQNKEPDLTRYTVGLLAKSQTLSIEKAKKELGYYPIVNMHDASLHIVSWWKNKHHS